MSSINVLLLRAGCFFFGHGKFKEYWQTISDGVQTTIIRCEICGKEKPRE